MIEEIYLDGKKKKHLKYTENFSIKNHKQTKLFNLKIKNKKLRNDFHKKKKLKTISMLKTIHGCENNERYNIFSLIFKKNDHKNY